MKKFILSIMSFCLVFLGANAQTTLSGNSLRLNADANYVTIPDVSSASLNSDMTWEFWIYYRCENSINEVVVASKGWCNSNQSYYLALQDGLVKFRKVNGTGNCSTLPIVEYVTDSNLVTFNTWSHISLVMSDTNAQFYLNGQPVNTTQSEGTAFTGIQTSPRPILIGAYQFLSGFYGSVPKANIDDFRIWHSARTSAQILNNYTTELIGNDTGLVAYYKMNETGSGSSITVANSATGSSIPNGTTVGTGPNIYFEDNNNLSNPIVGCEPQCSGTGPIITSSSASSYPAMSLNGSMSWVGNSFTMPINVEVKPQTGGGPFITLGNNSLYNLSYNKVWWGTLWDDVGLSGSTSVLPNSFSVYPSSGLRTDTIILSAKGAINGENSWIGMHQIDFATTAITFQLYYNGLKLDHNLVEVLPSSSSPATITASSDSIRIVGENNPARRFLIKPNLLYDSIVIYKFQAGTGENVSFNFLGQGNFGDTSSICNTPAVPLPVSIASFTGKVHDGINTLSWSILEFESLELIEIERSSNAIDFENIGFKELDGSNDYTFKDKALNAGINYYRLKTIGLDGEYSYSLVIALENIYRSNSINVFPNPTAGKMRIKIGGKKSVAIQLELYNTVGIKLLNLKPVLSNNIVDLDLSSFSSGIYYLKVNVQGKVFSRKLIKK